MRKEHRKNRINYINNTKKIYILRRVAAVFIAILLLSVLLFILFYKEPNEPTSNEVIKTPNNTFNTVKTTPNTPQIDKKITILLYHTHNDEAYYKNGKNYLETDVGRSNDENYNVIAVGKVLAESLKKLGFNVLHDKSDNISDGFNNAYDTSYKNIKNYKDIDIYIDLHRDAYSADGGKNYISGALGKEYAFIRFVVANGTNYNKKPNFKKNYELAENLKNELNKIENGICKDTFIKDARLNQHISDKCLLVEIGNEKNDIKQVKNSAELLAKAIAQIQENY